MTLNSTSVTGRRRFTFAKAIIFFILALPLALAPSAGPAQAAWDGVSLAEPTLMGEWYEIGTHEQLAGLRDWINDGRSADQKYKLTNHIDLNGKSWTPIGVSAGKEFKGIFDGNGFTIGNFKLRYVTGGASYGLFGNVKGVNARIENLGIVSFDIDINYTGAGVGSMGTMVGNIASGTIENCFSIGDIAVATSNGGINVGGLIGYTQISSSKAKNTLFLGNVTAHANANATANAGGIVGSLDSGKLEQSIAHGNVASSTTSPIYGSTSGGLVGRSNEGTVADSYSYCAVKAETNAGGLVGYHSSNYMPIKTISTSYAFGVITSGTNRGGIAGRNTASNGIQNSAFLYNGTLEGIGRDASNIDIRHTRSLDAGEFCDSAIFEGSGWNFNDIWTYTSLDHGERPRLRAFFVDENTIKPSGIALSPPELTIREGQGARASIAISDFTIGGPLSFDDRETFYRNGITISNGTSNGVFVVNADTELVGTNLDVEIGIPVGKTVQKKTYRIRTEGDLHITTTALPDGVKGKIYEALLLTANANGAVVFSVEGSLPEGISLDGAAGKLSGIPIQHGVFSFVATASDDLQTVSRTLVLTITEKADGTGGGGQPEQPSQPGQPNQPNASGQLAIDTLLSPLNEVLSGSSFTLGSPPADLGKPITTIKPGTIFQPVKASGKIFASDAYRAAADSFSVRLPLSSANGDLLALSYTVGLSKLPEEFAIWLEERFVLAYERENGSLALLIGDGGITSWRAAIASSAVTLLENGLTVHYAVRDAAGAPSLHGSVILIPDGANDEMITDPIWLLQKCAAEDETPEKPGEDAASESSGTGSSGCASGVFAFGIFGGPLLRFFVGRQKK